MTVGDPDQQPQPGLALLVTRVLGIAALVIAASAALFVGLGRLGDAPLVIAGGPDDEQVVDEEDQGADDDPAAEGDDGRPEEGEEAAEQEPAAPDDADEGDEGDAEAAEPEGDPDGEEPDAEPDEPEEPEEPAADRIDPSTVSVQVLDGYQADGGTAAGTVATELQDAGYRIVARNPALLYDITTVLWTAGHEQAGRQVAADLGAAEVREQPGNLSSSVMVHVVVGADRG